MICMDGTDDLPGTEIGVRSRSHRRLTSRLRPQFHRVLPSSAQRKTRAGLAVRAAGATRPDFMVWGGEGYRLLHQWRAARRPTLRAKRVSVEGSGAVVTLTSSITKAPEVLCSKSNRRV